MGSQNTDKKALAEWFLSHGFAIFPIDPKSKRPVIKEWEKYSSQQLNDEEKTQFIKMVNEGYNYAVPGGQKNLVILDFENTSLVRQWIGESGLNELCKKTLCVETVHGGIHVYVISDEIPGHKFNPAFLKDNKTVMDLQSHKSYVVGPGSCVNHIGCTSEKCPWKGQDHETCYTIHSNEPTIGKADLRGLLGHFAKLGEKIGIEISPTLKAWLEGKSKSEAETERDLEKLKQELGQYHRFKGKTVEAVREEVCASIKKNLDHAKSDKAKKTLGIAHSVVCEGKTYEEIQIDRSRGDWNTMKVLLSHGVTDVDMLQQLVPKDSKIFAPKWDYYFLETLRKAWGEVKPFLQIVKNAKNKKTKEIKNEVVEAISEQIIKHHHIVTFVQQHATGETIVGIFRFSPTRGVYEPIDERLRQVIRNYIMALKISMPNFDEKEGNPIYEIGKGVVEDVYDEIKDLTMEEYDDETPLRVAFKNCTLEWSTDKNQYIFRLIPANERTKKDYAFHYIPHRINVEIFDTTPLPFQISELEDLARKLCPKSLQAFRQWAGDKWITLFQILGYTLYPATKFKLAFMLLGPRDSGKSTYLQLLKRILGKNNTVSIRIKELFDSDNRFVMGFLFHKLVNLTAETKEYSIDDIDRFKTLTGGDQVTSDVKFKGPITFTPYSKIIVASNKLPNVSDKNDLAFWRRWMIIEFPNQFPNDDNWVQTTFTEDEIEGILTVSILAFSRVIINGRFDYQQTPEEVRDVWLNNIDSVWSFIKSHMEKGIITMSPRNADLWVTRAELYQLYKNYCMDNAFPGVSMRTFANKLSKYFGITSVNKYLGKDQNGNEIRKRCFVGITVNREIKHTIETETVNEMKEFIEYMKNNNHVVKEFWEIVKDFGDDKEKANRFVIWCEQRRMCEQRGIDVWEIHL